MNILMISPFDLVTERLWGPTIRLHSLAKEIINMGHRVVLAGPPPFDKDMPPTLDEVDLYYFKRPFHRYSYPDDGRQAERKRINRICKVPFTLVSRWLEIYRLAAKVRADVIYVNRAFPDTAYPAFLVHLLKNIPIICDWDDIEGVHGFSTAYRHPLRIQLLETINEVLFPKWADATVVASHYLRQFAISIGIPEDNIYYAPTVSDRKRFHPAVDGSYVRSKYRLMNNKVLLYAGNLCEENGVKIENILYTLKNLIEKDSTFILMIVGDGDLLRKNGQKGSLVKLAETLQISDYVVFVGGVPYQEMPRYIAAADACLALFPVNLITMAKSPLKVYEYMASGKVVVARDVGEISHCITNGKNGILVYSDRPEEYADRILYVFSQKDYFEKMRTNARRIIDEQFNWEASASVVMKACEKARSAKCCRV